LGLAQIGFLFLILQANRSVGVTDMNKTSSRSHSLLTLTVEQKGKDGSVKVGKINFGGLFSSP
jgi:hypothetical protein